MNAKTVRPKLVVIGNGMAGMRTVEELLKLAPDLYDVTVFGEEPHGNYNRILLSPVLAGEKQVDDIMLNTREWYAQNRITLHAGDPVVSIDSPRRTLAIVSAGTASLVSAGDYTVHASSVSTRQDLGGPGAIRLAGPLSGSGELVMNGSGSLTMTTAQSYSGGTRIVSGTVVLQGPAARAGSGAVQLGAGGHDGAHQVVAGAELRQPGDPEHLQPPGGVIARRRGVRHRRARRRAGPSSRSPPDRSSAAAPSAR